MTQKITVTIPVGPELHHRRWLDECLAYAVPQASEIIVYDDASEDERTLGVGSAAGTLVLTLPAAKTVEEIECSLSRTTSSANTHYANVQEVRVVGT